MPVMIFTSLYYINLVGVGVAYASDDLYQSLLHKAYGSND